MGQFRFFAPSHEHLAPTALAWAYLVGMEGIPWRSNNRWEHTAGATPVAFTIERSISESGNLHVPWRVPGYGELMLATASLMESETPYNLPLELARGIINRLRNQAAEWRMAGLSIPDHVVQHIRDASAAFIEAVTSQTQPVALETAVERTLTLGLDAGERLCEEYTRQALLGRHQQAEHLPTMLGCRLGSRPLSESERPVCVTGFNTAAISFSWRSVESNAGKLEWDAFDQQITWCQENNLRVIGGPLLQLDERHLPDWLYLWEDDFEQVQTYLTQYIRATVLRYRGRVQVWNCAARLNIGGSIALSEEQRLRLMVGAIDELRRHDTQAPIILSFDQPWAEYLATNDRDMSPLHLADSLVRADLGLAGIGVEFNIGYQPHGSAPRELLEYSRQLDRWAILGLPLVVYLSVPSANGEDPHARRGLRPSPNQHTPQTQAEFVDRLLPMILAKPFVQGIVWNDLTDADAHEFAHAGVIDSSGHPKPIMDSLRALRKQHLT